MRRSKPISKRRKVGILLIIIGTFIPSVLYPFATLTTDAGIRTILFALKGGMYKPRLNDLEIVLRKSDKPQHVDSNWLPYEPERNPYSDVGIQNKKVAIPYNYTVALGITIAFVGISFVVLSRKKKV